MKALHFGAGNIGRGFIGKVLADSGYQVTFADVNEPIIEQINQDKGYKVRYINQEKSEYFINNVQAINSSLNAERIVQLITEVDLLTTSVGIDNLKWLTEIIIKGLLERDVNQPIDIICNENAINATETLKKLIISEIEKKNVELSLDNVGFLNSAIDRQALSVTEDGENIALVEPFFEWVIEEENLKNKLNRRIAGVHYVGEISPYIERKLYIVNSEHAISAYLGYLHNKTTIQDVISTPELKKFLIDVLNEHAEYLKVAYQMDDLKQYINSTLQRHGSPFMADDINRVGRNPLRKLSSGERITGPLEKLIEYNLEYTNSIKAVAIGLAYRNSNDQEAVQLESKMDGVDLILAIREITGITDIQILKQIEIEYNKL